MMIGSSGLLLVGVFFPHLFAIPILVLWAALLQNTGDN
jgi:hypothetical protein